MKPTLFLLAMFVPALPAAEVTELLKATAEHYQKLHSYEFDGHLTTTIPGVPGQLRIAVTCARADFSLTPAGSSKPMLEEVCRNRQVQFLDVQGNPLASVPETVSFTPPLLASRYQLIHVHVANARRLSPAILQVDGRPVFCQVLKVVYDDPSVSSHEEAVQYWIDPKRLIVLQQNFAEIDPATNQRLQWTYTIDSVKLNQPPPQWLRESAEQQADHEVPNWIGRTAPDFALSDLEGRHFSLAKARGKVVVLDFWATWCSPCKEEMPTIEKLGRDYSSEEVEVWGVNHESPSSAREWLERSHSRIRTLADPDWEVFKLYEVEAIPVVVVIGREGKVASYYVGMQSERALHAAIESALQ